MAFNINAAKQAGYSDQEIQDYLSNQGGGGAIKGASNVLRSIGLGALPDIAGGAQFGIQKLLAGKNPFSAAGETPDQLQAETQGNQFINPQQTGGAVQAGKDLAGAASYLVPETKALPAASGVLGLLSGIGNRSIQGAAMGGLGAVAQGQDPIQGMTTGAITNPVLSGAGKLATDALPRYIGLRNYGQAGLKLPEVVKAENAATAGGYDSLKAARDDILGKIPSFALNAPEGSPQDRFALMNKIKDLAQQPQWIGTPGLSDLKRTGAKAFSQQAGILPDINKAIQNSADPFEAYNRLKNMAYAKDNTPAGNKIASFLRSAAHTAREHLITSSENPQAAAKAMDQYAAQTAMNAGAGFGNSKMGNIIGKAATGGVGEAGIAGLAAILPMLHGLSIPLLADTALTNAATGPTIARGLVNTGDKLGKSGAGNILRMLGIAGAQGVTSASAQ